MIPFSQNPLSPGPERTRPVLVAFVAVLVPEYSDKPMMKDMVSILHWNLGANHRSLRNHLARLGPPAKCELFNTGCRALELSWLS